MFICSHLEHQAFRGPSVPRAHRSGKMSQWWKRDQDAPRAPPAWGAAPQGVDAQAEVPRDSSGAEHLEWTQNKYTTLGYLKTIGHPNFRFYEFTYLKFIHRCLTVDWGLIQRGIDQETEGLGLWMKIFLALELDTKAQQDLMLLAQSGLVGRAEANMVMWNFLSSWALKPEYLDLSNIVTNMVGKHRRFIDRAPKKAIEDYNTWKWSKYRDPREPAWSPLAVPRNGWTIRHGSGGEPLAPPMCWGPLMGQGRMAWNPELNQHIGNIGV